MNTINQTTINQLGNRALVMMGTKKIIVDDLDNSITIKIGGNSKAITFINVKYNSSDDLYDITFYGKMINYERKIVKELSGIYFDKLHSIIENNTGLYLNL